MKYNIYKLTKDDNVIYIGKTYQRVDKWLNAGYREEFDLIKICDDIEIIEKTNNLNRYQYWIDYYWNLGEPLINKIGLTESNI